MLAIRIKELRTSLSMTQKEFSECVGCTAATLSAYENNSKSPSLEIIKTIAEKCHVSIDWLCGLVDKKNLSGDYDTYGDIASVLLKIDDRINLVLDEKKISDYESYTGIFFEDSILNSFLEEWNEASNVLNNTSINKDITKTMYESWQKTKLEELENKKLKKRKRK